MNFHTTASFMLASKSPRRRELFAELGIPFNVQQADVEETSVPFQSAEQYVRDVALLKAQAVFQTAQEAVVIGSDTIVVLDGELLHKPQTIAEATAHLQRLSGRTHDVMTAVAIVTKNNVVTFVETTHVTFREVRQDFIDAYVATGDPFDKAGGYGIQNAGAFFVEKIDGDYLTVVGLPLSRLTAELMALGVLAVAPSIQIEPFTMPFTAQVIDHIVGIQQEEFGVNITADDQPDLRHIDTHYIAAGGCFYIARIGGRIVGTIAAVPFDGGMALKKMFVQKNYRGKPYRIAERLLAAVAAQIDGPLYLGTIDVFKAAQRFYANHGFTQIAKDALPKAFPAMDVDNVFYVREGRV
ncbi:Maf family nucleotide pyrophosphatase [Kurthia huakuii]|uniref:Maf family nucleotide pyrophosphatase n=1 Tax=Kurthia huakuii TaxID=1421019 RepID=UPI00049569F9|nr:MAF protein [Kurthia huakuii]